jgi:hypothetical protein
MNEITALLNSLAPIVGFLVAGGLVVKYVPVKMLTYIDNQLIPLIGAILTFLGPLDGLGLAPAAAQAGIFGGLIGAVGAELSTLAKGVLATGIMAVATGVYELIGRKAMQVVGAKKYDPNAPPVDMPVPPIVAEPS